MAIGANLLSIAAVVIENLCSQRHTASWLNTSVINSAGIERHNLSIYMTTQAENVLEMAKTNKDQALDFAHKNSESGYSPVDVSEFEFEDGSILICKNSVGEFQASDFELKK